MGSCPLAVVLKVFKDWVCSFTRSVLPIPLWASLISFMHQISHKRLQAFRISCSRCLLFQLLLFYFAILNVQSSIIASDLGDFFFHAEAEGREARAARRLRYSATVTISSLFADFFFFFLPLFVRDESRVVTAKSE